MNGSRALQVKLVPNQIESIRVIGVLPSMLNEIFSYVDSADAFVYFNLGVDDFGERQSEIEAALAKRDSDREGFIRTMSQAGYELLLTEYRGKYFHEWHHCLQHIFYPFQYLQSWRELNIALQTLRHLRTTAESVQLGKIGLLTEWSETLKYPAMVAGIDIEGEQLVQVEREVADLRPTDITVTDLIEEATSIFQFKVEIDDEGAGESYQRWIREGGGAYANVFRLLSRFLGNEGAYVALPPLVQAAFHTSWPTTAFVSLVNFTLSSDIPPEDLGCDLYYKILSSEKRWSNVNGSSPDPAGSGLSDEFSFLDLNIYKGIISRTPNHTVYPLAKRYVELIAVNPEMDSLLFHPHRKESKDILTDEFQPLVTAIRLHHKDLTGRETIFRVNPKLLDVSLPLLPGVTYRDYFPEIGKRKDVMYSIITDINEALQHNCYHENCPFYPTNVCRRWTAIPKDWSSCPFPKWFEQVTTRSIDPVTGELKKLPQWQQSYGGD